MLLSPNKS